MKDIVENVVVDGRYRVLRRIGSGGMADVYCAEDTHLGRKVALKVLHRRFAQDAEFVERFRREASAAAGLQHPNVVSVYDRGRHDGTYYIAMEYLSGRSLKEILREENQFDPRRAIEIVKQILSAVRFAHRHNIVHRDIKPQNVILDEDGRVKVTDFGIARAGASEITETGSILGTAQYLAPEQAQGKETSGASDLYSIGVVLYEMLTGRVPFEGDTAVAIALKHVSEKPPSPRKFAPWISPSLDRAILRALAKQREDRYRSADEFINTLDRVEMETDSAASGEETAVFHAPAKEKSTDGDGELPAEALLLDRSESESQSVDRADFNPNKRRRLIWAGIAALVLALGFGGYMLFMPSKVVLPDEVGKQIDDSRAELGQLGLRINVKRVNSEAAVDTVLEQSPLKGTKVKEGSSVLLTVSKGPEVTRMPDVSGLAEKSAKKQLRDAGLKVRVEKENSSDVQRGMVIKTDPASGQAVAVGSRVTLVVSSGPARVEIPGLIGQGKDAAVSAVKELGLNVVIEQVDSEKPKDEVVGQSPSAGTNVDKGSSVTLEVSNGSKRAEVPDVTGLSSDTASSKLEEAGFSVSVKSKVTKKLSEDGVVLSQSPTGGKEATKGDKVVITVGKFEPDIPPEDGTP